MKIYQVEFEGIYPVGSCLIIAAYSMREAKIIASNTIGHTSIFEVEEVDITSQKVVCYLSGDY